MNGARVASSSVCRFFRSNGEEIHFVDGFGGKVEDSEGRTYVDFVLGSGPVVIGHRNSRFQQLLASHLVGPLHLPGYAATHERLAMSVADPEFDEVVGFFKHSSDAITAAIRLATHRTDRFGVIRCGYIGWHDALIAKTPRWHEQLTSPLRGEVRFEGHFRGVSGSERVFNWVDLELGSLAKELEGRGNDYACLVIDTYQFHHAARDRFAAAVEMCRSQGILVVADETKTAGRVAPRGVFAKEGLPRADMTVLGKAISNGAPLSLLVGSREIMSLYPAAAISGTHCKELFGPYAAMATAQVMSERSGYEVLADVGDRGVSTFNDAARSEGIAGCVQAVQVLGGSMFDLTFADELLGQAGRRQALARVMADEGVLLLQGHPSFVCLDQADLDWDRLGRAFARALRSWTSGGEGMSLRTEGNER